MCDKLQESVFNVKKKCQRESQKKEILINKKRHKNKKKTIFGSCVKRDIFKSSFFFNSFESCFCC